ncbi:YhcG family protein [Cupriavidus sp. AU9028]|uniref:PDDEXK nuclease domain-containing protein n=1 Tax=Cupriavidus sp. AU9028 TaxID=2871157 RepID=UPI001C976474|nr:PDDEXK nuclease domain-containing protein [Cupriavidus sp. AU9028]MBY4898268.1 PDDEXK nuclease domain-containing protein [Cupriavidus sp. AU9028]
MASDLVLNDYIDWLEALKNRISAARSRAALAVNAELVRLYHEIGRDILERQTRQRWGSKVIERVARDLKAAFPDMKGFSGSNLKYMRYFAEHCPDARFGQQAADQLPWFHIVTLLTKLPREQREWYAVEAVTHGWSRLALERHIQNRLHERQGGAISNFQLRLPAPDSALAHETLKDPYLFDFLGLADDAHERDIENALIRHITRFLLELGAGFAFVGRQFRLDVGGDEFFIDLLFYHTRLKCYVVVELKAGAFKPEHIGQLNFYLSVVDDQVRAPDDKPTIGLLLCRKQNRLVAQYAVNGIDKPIGVAEFQLLQNLQEPLAQNLPSIEEIEAELAGEMDEGRDRGVAQ